MRRSHVRKGMMMLAAVAALGALPKAASATARFGTFCQSDFQNGWASELPQVWTHCAWFNEKLNDYDSHIFYWNLHGGKTWLEAGGDWAYVDDVDLLYMNTHGGAGDGTSQYAMWDDNIRADTASFRMGDNAWWGGGLAILTTYACHTLQYDGQIWYRWYNAFAGGLKYVLGSHDLVFDGTTTNETGEDYAAKLQQGWVLKDAWVYGVTDWWADQDAAVLVTGTTSSDCVYRLNSMTWQNYGTFSFIRDSSIGYMCMSYWNDL